METTVKMGQDTQIHVSRSRAGDSKAKPTIIFLHFWGGSSRTWSKVIQILSLAGHKCDAIDFRGWGQSTGPKDPTAYSMQTLAKDVEQVIQDLDIKQYILIGHSMGGKVAQVLAGQSKYRGMKGIVLVAPAPPSPLILPEDARKQQEHAYDNPASAEFVVRNVLTASPGLSDEDVDALVQDMIDGTPEARAAWPSYGMAEDIRDVVREISVPVLVIGAAKDQVETIDRLRSEVLGNISGAQLEVIQESGHLIPFEAPEALVGHISKFLDTIESK